MIIEKPSASTVLNRKREGTQIFPQVRMNYFWSLHVKKNRGLEKIKSQMLCIGTTKTKHGSVLPNIML